MALIPNKGEINISPAARALAKAHGVNIKSLKGSGVGGRIVKEDVDAAIAAAKAPKAKE